MLITFIFSNKILGQENVCVSKEEMKLYRLIMKYRKAKGLKRIPLSKSLTHVAQLHVKDLTDNKPDKGKKCNLHSWSNKGKWKSCCYTSNHAKASCMWNKPRELTSYRGSGFEIAHWSSAGVTAKSAINGWKNSSGHNAVMVNIGTWKKMEWGAIGIGIYKNYAVVWFGRPTDEAGKPTKCE